MIDIDGANERMIFNERAQLSSPKWSTDGAWIAFSRGDEYVECYDLGHNQCITPDEFKRRFRDRKPEEDYPLVKQYSYKLAAVDANGDNYHDIGSMPSAKALDWNEAGIVYQSSDGIQRTADATDAVNQLVAFDQLKPYYYDPDWQPNGGQIAFQVKGAAQWEIYVVNPDGTDLHGITQPVTTLVDVLPSNVAPAYSPDGNYIVYLSNRGDDNSAGAWRLWVMAADGSNPHPLAIDVPIEYNLAQNRWSVGA
ncbi:MAG: PD40 domain-containing protein [Anaerolineales bacterium]|nr:PD40 domain-containing protein [Anaerolineales bacterium]